MPRLLVVEDSASLRATLRRMLESAGFEVLEAENGVEGAAALQCEAVDAVITDIVMPDMDGLQLIREVRTHHPGLKILAISGHSEGSLNYLDLATKLGADGVLAKPFDVDSLVRAMTDLLGPSARPGGA